MTATHRAIEAVRAALDSYEAANTGRDEARAIGSLMTVTDPDNMHLILAAIAAVEAERDALRAAAQALVDRWDTPLWKDVPHTGEFIHRLRAALAAQPKVEPVEALRTYYEHEPMDEWVAYAKRGGLLNAEGLAPDPAKAQTAWFAFTYAWNRSAALAAQPDGRVS